MEKRIPVWVLALVVLVGINGSILFGWSVDHVLRGGEKLGKYSSAILTVARFPLSVKRAFVEIGQPRPLIIDNRFPDIDGFKKDGVLPDGVLNDDGYLLISTYSPGYKQSTIKLLRISDQQVVHEWTPSLDALVENHDAESPYFEPTRMTASRYRLWHPMLLTDGGVVLHGPGGGPLVKIDSCSSIEWAADGMFHHSIEQDREGNFWAGFILAPGSYSKTSASTIEKTFQGIPVDEGIAQVSPNGKILFNKSIATILEENGYRGLLYGAGLYQTDAIHSNDIQPAHYSTKYWQKGDVLVSMKNRSAIFLYRPSTDKIIWLRNGPWLNQHDVDFIGDSKISIFGNDSISITQQKKHLIDGHNNVYIFNLADGSITSPYANVLKQSNVSTVTEGLQEFLENGDVFIEEQNNGRLLRVSATKVIWEYTDRVDNDTVKLPSWSRYLKKEKVEDILPILEETNCL